MERTTTNPWISPNQLMHTLHALMTAYSMHQTERCHAPPSKSSPLPSMQCKGNEDFAKEYDEIKEEQDGTVQAAGYTQANNAIQISEALDDLANAAMSDRKTVEDFSKANKELAKANRQLTSQMEQISEKLASITKLIEAIPTTSNNMRGGRFTNQCWKPVEWDPRGYWWSYHYRVDKKHNNVTCSRKKDGHQDAETRSNTMGGSQAGRPNR
eukprot:7040599-Ditylum_brightwellii.AAC.1